MSRSLNVEQNGVPQPMPKTRASVNARAHSMVRCTCSWRQEPPHQRSGFASAMAHFTSGGHGSTCNRPEVGNARPLGPAERLKDTGPYHQSQPLAQ